MNAPAEPTPLPLHDPDQVTVDPYSVPLEKLDVANPYLFEADVHQDWFKRLRDEAPVHYCAESEFGPYWSVTRYEDIMTVDTSHKIYSSEPTITIRDQLEDFQLPMFIAMDRPKHDIQRNTVSPRSARRHCASSNRLSASAPGCARQPAGGRALDWVDSVSIELTTRMLATLFDFPFEERRKLTYWSDLTTTLPGVEDMVETEDEWKQEMLGCLEYFIGLWNQRAKEPPANDFISRMVHGEATKDMDPMEYLGNLLLLIVGGNDTTRSTMSSSVLCLDRNPAQFAELRGESGSDPADGLRNHPLADARWRTCAAPPSKTRNSAARPSARATRW
jgi:cytochrome P450